MRRSKLLLGLLMFVLTVSNIYAKQSGVTLTSKSYKEVLETNKKGEKQLKLVDVGKVLPGDVILYKNTINNAGAKAVKNMVLSNPIPEHTEYIKGSAICTDDCKILFSIDGGKVFNLPQKLTIKKGDVERIAHPKEYTNVRWILISALAPNSATDVSFKAKLK